MKNTTAIVINFLREPYLYKCLDSIKFKYPDIPVLVGENGKYTKDKKEKIESYKNVKYYRIKYDAGVCKARNELVKKVKTKYVLVGDDDFEYYEKSDLDKMETFLDNNNFDLIGGRITEGGIIKNYQGNIKKYEDHFVYEPLELNNYNKCSKSGLNYKSCDLTFNFFIAKTEAIKDVLWDENIKVAYEHSSFFIDFINKGYKVAFTPDILVIHKPLLKEKIKDINNYKVFRFRKTDKEYFFKRFNISYVKSMNGKIDYYDETNMSEITFCITMFERWEKLKNLLYSIVKYYPTAKILIADQGKKFKNLEYRALYEDLKSKGLINKPTAYNMPFDSGLSACRNKLVGLANTPYVLILEEDFVFTENTKIKDMYDILENNKEYSGIGGQVYNNGIDKLNFFHNYKKKGKTIEMVDSKEDYNEQGVREIESILNFVLFRRELFDKVKWENNIKISGEHTDFMLQCKDKGIKLLECNFSSIDHDKSRDDIIYTDMRSRDEGLKILFNKYKINKLKYANGFTILLKDSKIVKGRGI